MSIETEAWEKEGKDLMVWIFRNQMKLSDIINYGRYLIESEAKESMKFSHRQAVIEIRPNDVYAYDGALAAFARVRNEMNKSDIHYERYLKIRDIMFRNIRN